MPVHPRVCGERGVDGARIGHLAGSSPRVRGTPGDRRPRAAELRFIPACAGNAAPSPTDRPRWTVHPRVCGERSSRLPVATFVAGSSPRVRGTPSRPASPLRLARFIPACAGNAPPSPRATPALPVHPRVCGERSRGRWSGCQNYGSSPRVRGTPPPCSLRSFFLRFIPACAGNAPGVSDWRSTVAGSSPRVRGTRYFPLASGENVAVHPRVCGERRWRGEAAARDTGSSPRVRGTLAHRGRLAPVRRFIPACAGNATRWSRCGGLAAVHPRVCGERIACIAVAGTSIGSSPRVRGTPGLAAPAARVPRFIPACAGNACSLLIVAVSRPVHPRVCGERRMTPAERASADGSSPRVRGTLRRGGDRPAMGRFIPACAGNAPIAWKRARNPPVHPRVCGERHDTPLSRQFVDGSSPRVRGTRSPCRRGARARRFIPACAGNALAADVASVASAGSSPRVRGTLGTSLRVRAAWRFIPACAGNARKRTLAHRATSVHPRVCGERWLCSRPCGTLTGSSPRVRGTPNRAVRQGTRRRFIPACAGNAVSSTPKTPTWSVHPRVCGERARAWRQGLRHAGSSPRVRGTPSLPSVPSHRRRFIPACAGNACPKAKAAARKSVHPRVCGERKRSHGEKPNVAGSSPRVRGTRSDRTISPLSSAVHPRVCGERGYPAVAHGLARRFIPACAGNAALR